MGFVNLSAEPEGKLRSWLPHGLQAEAVVFLPDACPGKSPLPTGTAVRTRQSDWRRFAVSDCGCGMRLLRTELAWSELTQKRWDRLAELLRRNKGGLGDLGGGNHFLDALVPVGDGALHFLIHTGSRAESGHVDAFVDDPSAFDGEFGRVVAWAAANRAAVQRTVETVFGTTEAVLDLPHNTFERLGAGDTDGVIVRKGSVRVRPGDLTVLPSHLSGDVVLLRATTKVEESLGSLSHGTGRTMPRSECKARADHFDFAGLRGQILFPTALDDASLRSEVPHAYRDLDACLALLEGFVEVEERYAVVGYLGHL